MNPCGSSAYQIANSSEPGNIILDTFGGSGTIIVACEQLGRKAPFVNLYRGYFVSTSRPPRKLCWAENPIKINK